uniref:Uncharacterized protein n=1 Tax=Peronospora matthiolae TaxID=2874970 RepID=A0AAV1TRD3_9STRA
MQLTKRKLKDETLLSLEKDMALQELDAALSILREEILRQRSLLEKSEMKTERLKKQNAELETQVQEKSALLHEWIHTTSGQRGGEAPSSASEARKTQERSERMTQLLDESGGLSQSGPRATLITQTTHSVRDHATEVNSVCFNASGNTLFSGSSDGTVKAWEAEAGSSSAPRALGE